MPGTDSLKSFLAPLILLWKIIIPFWWIWGPAIILTALVNNWLPYIRRKYWESIDWVTLEIKPSQKMTRSPKSVEQICHGLWNIFGSAESPKKWDTIKNKYLHGAIQDYFSLEIVGIGGKVHFLIRIPRSYQKIVETQIYSQNPQAELVEIEDYTNLIGPNPLQHNWDVWGTKFILSKDDAYPIRTYPDFLDIVESSKAEGIIDPLASLIESLNSFNPNEYIWLQIISRPVNDEWQKKGRTLINKLIGKIEKKEMGLIEAEIRGWIEAIENTIHLLVHNEAKPSTSSKEAGKPGESLISHLSPGEVNVVKAIENKISKKGFETKINLIYLAPKNNFDKSNKAPASVFIKQFNLPNLNSFTADKNVVTIPIGRFPQSELLKRKKKIIKMCRERSFWDKGSVLNSEEIASIFHFPVTPIEAPAILQTESKKIPPPPELPIEN